MVVVALIRGLEGMRKVTALTAILVLLPLPGVSAAAPRVQGWNTAVFRVSCLDHSFLRISAFTFRWKKIPAVELRLRDPLGRTAGSDRHMARVPSTRYGETAEIPSRPSTTRALHLEICDAATGRYALTIKEHGTQSYFLSIGGDDGTSARLGPTLLFQPTPGRICEYRFRFERRKSRVWISWLDLDGHELAPSLRPVCKPILKA